MGQFEVVLDGAPELFEAYLPISVHIDALENLLQQILAFDNQSGT
jgi:hypothetical protein